MQDKQEFKLRDNKSGKIRGTHKISDCIVTRFAKNQEIEHLTFFIFLKSYQIIISEADDRIE